MAGGVADMVSEVGGASGLAWLTFDPSLCLLGKRRMDTIAADNGGPESVEGGEKGSPVENGRTEVVQDTPIGRQDTPG